MVLSLKWRPQSFSELEGQKPIQQILTHAVKYNSLHPALIFAGPKGTGKTSTARILAKALRCEKKTTHEPCNQCVSCQAIKDGSDMDVIEIDGASNNGVDAIRHLRDSVQYMPVSGSKRIYIIDEVHMLSQSAFNALLKTLEEPPAHVTFIMATTELRKIPSTVASRCQIFNFRPISPPIIQKRLKAICKAENIQIDDEALWLIVEQSERSMRNAQVLLDQMACFGRKKISSRMIIDALGLSHRSLLNAVLTALIQKNSERILSFMDDLALVDPQIFLDNLLVQIRNVLMIKWVKNPSWLFLMESEKEILKELAQSISSEEIHFLFDMTLKGREDLTKSFDPHITLEMILLRMSQAGQIEELLSRDVETNKQSSEAIHPRTEKSPSFSSKDVETNKQSSKAIHPRMEKSSSFSSKDVETNKQNSKAIHPRMESSSLSSKKMETNKQNSSKPVSLKKDPKQNGKHHSNTEEELHLVLGKQKTKQWIDFIQFITEKNSRFASQMKRFCVHLLQPQKAVLGYSSSALFLKEKVKDKAFQKKLEQYAFEFFKEKMKFHFVLDDSFSLPKDESQKKLVQEMEGHPVAQKIANLFQARVLSVDKHTPSK